MRAARCRQVDALVGEEVRGHHCCDEQRETEAGAYRERKAAAGTSRIVLGELAGRVRLRRQNPAAQYSRDCRGRQDPNHRIGEQPCLLPGYVQAAGFSLRHGPDEVELIRSQLAAQLARPHGARGDVT